MKQLGVGIIGAGIVGTGHAKRCKINPNLKVIGVTDIVKERAERLAKEVGAKAYTDFKKMLRDKEIEIVFVATPPTIFTKIL